MLNMKSGTGSGRRMQISTASNGKTMPKFVVFDFEMVDNVGKNGAIVKTSLCIQSL